MTDTTLPEPLARQPRRGHTLLLPGFEPPPRPIDRKAEIVAKVLASDLYRETFIGWLQDNWGVWQRFEFEANKLRDRGRRHYSARTIGEYIRHSTSLREKEPTFKVNDHVWPDCARLYMEVHPEAAGFFETRGRQ